MKELRAASYARYSSKRRSVHSADDQHRLNEEYASRNNMEVVYKFSDAAKSGRMARTRSGIQALYEVVKERKVDIILLEAVDRVGRSMRVSATFREMMDYYQVQIHTLSGPADPFTFGANALVAEKQSLDSAVRTRARQIQRLKEDGRAAALPYGYRSKIGDGLNREIDPDQAEIVRRIYMDFANGMSPIEIARRLNAEGVPGPRGGQWCDNTIRGHGIRQTGILRNPMYRGLLVYGRVRYKIDPETDSRKSITNLDPNEIETVEYPELRIVDDDLFELVQKRVAAVGFKNNQTR